MDPVWPYAKLQQSFGPKPVPKPVPDINITFSLAQPPNLVPLIPTDGADDRAEPELYFYLSLETQQVLRELELKLNESPYARWALLKTDCFAGLGLSEFNYRDALIGASIDNIFNFTQHIGGVFARSTIIPNKPLYFMDINGGPGGMVEYICWRRPDAHGIGISLEVPYNKNVLPMDLQFEVYNGTNFNDNIIDSYQILSTRLIEIFPGGLHVLSAKAYASPIELSRDGSVPTPKARHIRILLTALWLAITCLRADGTLILELPECSSRMMGDFILLVATLFKDISLYKPLSYPFYLPQGILVAQSLRTAQDPLSITGMQPHDEAKTMRRDDPLYIDEQERATREDRVNFIRGLIESKNQSYHGLWTGRLPVDLSDWLVKQNVLMQQLRLTYLNKALLHIPILQFKDPDKSLNRERIEPPKALVHPETYNFERIFLLWQVPASRRKLC